MKPAGLPSVCIEVIYSFALSLFISVMVGLPTAADGQEADYRQELVKWRQAREQALKAEDGWLNLAGLFWLQPGKNTFGSSPSNTLVFPKGKIAARAGTLVLGGKEVWLQSHPRSGIRVAGRIADTLLLYSDTMTRPPVAECGNLRFHIIRREDKIGVRLRDLKAPAVTAFSGIPCFTGDERWKMQARLIPGGPFKTIPITNILGQTARQKSPGQLIFEIDGIPCTLQALEEEGKLFILFADDTNGKNTYPSGRFMYADMPDETGFTILDFNKAFNPPCAFTPFATCPLPPPENRLKLAVTAGEQYLSKH